MCAPLSVKEPRVKRGRGLYFSIQPSVGGSRSPTNAAWGRKAGDGSRAMSCRWTPSLISVLGLRSLQEEACRLHDDRWGVLASNTNAAARSFEAVQLEETLPRWQQGAPRSRPLPATLSSSSYVLGSAMKRRRMHSLKLSSSENARLRPAQSVLLRATGSLIASSPNLVRCDVLGESACVRWTEPPGLSLSAL